ncbi:MAG: transcription-repair coupling factor [Micrococcales bacterium 73-15]|uniref:transcription-repair coupling factor n=1 Tax=Salana multivorans TaxID=120377 RepID=UPI00095ED177|nr:transcription-repair coupling factor [Salana multivorans]OJX94006.1 MAG: transcription-repair coupling factor [Micrococcales bacterium 73-15]
MKLSGILPILAEDAATRAALAVLPARGELDVVAPAGVRAPFLAELAEAAGSGGGTRDGGGARQLVVVTATGRDADELAAALRAYLPADSVAVLPAWETLPHERLSPRADTVAKRLAVLRRLAHPEVAEAPGAPGAGAPDAGARPGHGGPIRVLVVPSRALLQPVATGLGDLAPVSARAGETHRIEDLAAALTAAAYTRVDMVEKRGDFAVRGGILDVFPPTEDHPLRLDFWGDDIEEIRWFAVADQRSLEIAPDGLWAPPCRELLLTPRVRERALGLRDALPGATDMLERMAEGIAVEGMESLTPALVDGMEQVLDLVDPDALLVLVDPERIRRRAHDLVATTDEFLAAAWTSAAAGGSVPLDLSAASFVTLAQARATAARRGLGWWSLTPFALGGVDDADAPADAEEPIGAATTLRVDARDVEGYRGEIARAITDLRDLIRDGWRLVLVTEGAGPARRWSEQLGEADVAARLVADLPEEPEPGVVHVTTATIGKGFVMPAERFAIFTEADLTGRTGTSTRDMRALAPRRRNVVDPLALRAGDYVVHEQHGVGRFVELVQRTVTAGGRPGSDSSAMREYLVIEYAASKRGQPGDRLYVPTDALDQVTKYVGGEAPSLSKMGGADWKNTKAKARKAVKEIAGELVRLYAARQATQGHTFGPDTPWQRELEDAFDYVETADQLVTIDEVKRDMERSVPMDRLILGDVGYGKTEVAVRAAFKAVQDGKQVAVLVPTTLLVSQHLQTFTERYAGFPVNVAALSRFQTDAESKTVKEGVADGTIDVVIGTHRLLTGEVRFKDLGLVIIDEEQRFGVEHKETLKQLRTNVDVLAMSATPIPRTLEMAVTGIREMSTLATPPEERHPVLTFVGPYEEKQITAAIRRELLREGQVFYVHNRVESIEKAASRLAELVPEARIGVAHGKMNEHQLERVIQDFWEKRLDVLVSTTIVETGLDIANANTLILERADVLGLSQLHQLRGRVGRGRERAYAYFLYPPEKPLTETAHDRLATIAANTDLGAGMQVALKDLEIRGAGNLLGGEQSGHIAGVGFDLYVRMVSEAVGRYRGEDVEELADVTIELPLDAHIPHEYVPHERLRLEAYTKIASAATPEDVEAVREELVDRYGPVPPSVELLFQVAGLRTVARSVGVTAITAQGQFIRFAPVELPDSGVVRLKRLYPRSIIKAAVRTILVPAPTQRSSSSPVAGEMLRDGPLVEWVLGVLRGVVGGSVAAAAATAAAASDGTGDGASSASSLGARRG